MNTTTSDNDFQEQLRLQAHLLDVIGQAVIATDLNGMITYVNRFAERLYGWEWNEAIGRPLVELITADATPEHVAGFRDSRRRGENWSGEFNVVDRGGRTFPILVTTTP